MLDTLSFGATVTGLLFVAIGLSVGSTWTCAVGGLAIVLAVAAAVVDLVTTCRERD